MTTVYSKNTAKLSRNPLRYTDKKATNIKTGFIGVMIDFLPQIKNYRPSKARLPADDPRVKNIEQKSQAPFSMPISVSCVGSNEERAEAILEPILRHLLSNLRIQRQCT
jgi:hypothetical protein